MQKQADVLREAALVLVGTTSEGGEDQPEAFIRTSPLKRSAEPKRVLLVEDHLDTVHSLTYLLRAMGHAVEYATSGYAAIEAARRFRPEFVLLDLGLPGTDGFAVCYQIKRDPELRQCRVVALTAFSQETYRQRAKEAGCEGYLVKPVHTKVIEELLG
jgi:CheY-like chemotaxis protein